MCDLGMPCGKPSCEWSTTPVNDGKVPCRECGARFCTGFTESSDLAKYFSCGDCLEGRTPLKREVERLRSVLESLLTIDDGPGHVHEIVQEALKVSS